MLITQENILRRFSENLSWATEVWLASAWATSNEGLRALQRRSSSLEVRAIVGLWGNLTEPFALRILAKIGQLRLADASRRFHPKVYVFRGHERSVAWIGSANFTSGGFGINEEVMLETSDTETAQNWFRDLWERCAPLDESAIDDYEELRQANPPSPPPRSRSSINLHPSELLQGVRDWRSYVAALQECDTWWSHRHSWSVLGEQCSWRETIAVLHDVLKWDDWGELGDYDRRRLLGAVRREDWALLGRMRGNSPKTVFGANRETIQKTVQAVVEADDSAFPQLALESYEALLKIDGVGKGIATRLLTIARPDRFVSLNNASRKGLAAFSGLPPTTLAEPKNYSRLLTNIYNRDWYVRPHPRNTLEEAISRMRVALLDCFFYEKIQYN